MAKSPAGIPSLKEHVDAIDAFEARLKARRGVRADDRARMLAHRETLLRYYEGVEAEASFGDQGAAVFDVVPTVLQPSLRGVDGPLPVPPDAPGASTHEPYASGTEHVSALSEANRDRHGNPRFAPSDTVPLMRMSMAQMLAGDDPGSRKQAPPGWENDQRLRADIGPDVPALPGTNKHFYSHAQSSISGGSPPSIRGGHGIHSVYSHALDLGELKQHFSNSQQWYVGSGPQLQTVEVGYIQLKGSFGHPDPAPFVFTTRSSYGEDKLTYNLMPGAPFVQTNNLWGMGAAVSPVSAIDGSQRVLSIGAFLDTGTGHWWVYIGGKSAADAVGYLPRSWWASDEGQQGMEVRAYMHDRGGEVSVSALDDGNFYCPPMGSGLNGNQGWRKSAYIRNIQIYGMDGSVSAAPALGSGVNLSADMFYLDPSYTSYAPPWNRTLWYGGPGGTRSTT